MGVKDLTGSDRWVSGIFCLEGENEKIIQSFAEEEGETGESSFGRERLNWRMCLVRAGGLESWRTCLLVMGWMCHL